MSKAIKKYQQLPAELKKMQEDSNAVFSVGDMFFSNEANRLLRIREIKKKKRWDGKKEYMDWKIFLDDAHDWEVNAETEWSACKEEWFDEFINDIKEGEYAKLDRPFKEIMDEANKVISGEISIDVYKQDDVTDSLSNESALIGRSTKDGLMAMQRGLEEKRNTANIIHKAVKYEMEKRKAELEKVKDGLYAVVAVFNKQVKKIMRVINTIELYLGIEEEIHQIQSGEKAPKETPISFRQLVLFMDEEVGAHEDGGLDFRDVKSFDKWLLTGNNIDIVLPEKKGIVVLNPRRNPKKYNESIPVFVTAKWNAANLYNTYILIRNGDNIHRIFTEKLIINERLFPLKNEMNELFERMQSSNWDSEKEKIEDSMYEYKDRAMMLQGIVDRTEIFHPLPVDRLNIFKLDDAGKYVNFIYDAEPALTQGKPMFNDWRKQINEQIQEGSRVLTNGEYYRPYSTEDWKDRFYLAKNSYDGLKNIPDLPKKGVYQVEEFISTSSHHLRKSEVEKRMKEWEKNGIKCKNEGILKGKSWRVADEKTGSKDIYVVRTFSKEKELTIMYLPNEKARSGWDYWETHDRKNRTRFNVYKDDDFIMNYDQMDVSDIDYYLQSRIDREDYLSMMPFLKETKKHLLAEQKNESFFIDFVVGRNLDKLPKLTDKQIRERVVESVRWWKYKNKWKRAINKDDTLALRMIEKRITSPKYKAE